MHQMLARVLSNRKVGPFMLLKLAAPGPASSASPGQFVMLKSGPGAAVFLRRPLSIHDLWFAAGKLAGILLLYQVVGKGTELISRTRPGQAVSLVGPLGVGFSPCRAGTAVLVAGGIGIAPLRFLSRSLNAPNVEVVLLAGARTKDMLCKRRFPRADTVILSTDDGSEGLKGPVTYALRDFLSSRSAAGISVYSAGPAPMLREVARLCRDRGVPCQLSLESVMACGVGACFGCAVRAFADDRRPTYLRVCKDGPVFDSGRLLSF